MKKILLFFTILISNYLFCQVTIDGITVNNVGISGTTISLGTLSTVNVNLNASVVLSSSPSDSYPGTITIYYKKATSLPAIVANGGESSHLLFLGGTFAIRSFRLTLNSAQFDNSGGILYAEYKTYSGITTKSSNISITKNIPSEPGGGGVGGGCEICSSEFVPFGGIPIFPYSAPSQHSYSDYKWFIERPTGELVPYSTDRGKEIYESYKLLFKKEGDQLGLSASVFTIHTQRPYSRYDNYIQRLNISNSIEQNQTIEYGGTPETIIGTVGNVNGQPNNTYQWQERLVAEHQTYVGLQFNVWKNTYGWKDIPNANQINYTPPSNATQVKAYRRLIYDTKNVPMSSNEVIVYVISRDETINNTICCDNTYFSGNTINSIVGSVFNNGEFYAQWQKGIMINNQIVWFNIDKANSKDYTPVRPGGRGNSYGTFYYRRALIHRLNNKFYISNMATVIFSNASGRSNSKIIKNQKISDIDIIVYPNPSSSVVNIESEHDLSSFNAKIIDMTGRLILKNNYELSGYSTQLNISDLPTGIYTIIIENDQDKIIKKLIKK